MAENEKSEGGDEGTTKVTPTAPKIEPKIEPKVEPKVAVAPPERKPEPPKAPDATSVGDDDEIPEAVQLIQLSKTALDKRLARHTKSELKAQFGTDDPTEIKAKLDKFAEYEAEKEAARVAALSEQEKLKEEAAAANKRADEAEKKHQRAVDQQVFSEYDREAAGVVGEHVAEKHVKRAIRELKEHVLSLDDADLAKPKKVFETWTKDFVKENPEFAKAAPPPPPKIPLTNGADPNARRERSDVSLATKTPKPGQPNSMSRAEFAQYKRQRGLS
jgi:hypothetical protein